MRAARRAGLTSALIGIAVALLAGCGGGGSSDDDYGSQIADAIKPLAEQGRLGVDLSSPQPNAKTLKALDGMVDMFHEARTGVEAVDPPEEHRRRHFRLVAVLRVFETTTQELQTTAESVHGDAATPEAQTEMVQALQTYSTKALELQRQQTELLKGYLDAGLISSAPSEMPAAPAPPVPELPSDSPTWGSE